MFKPVPDHFNVTVLEEDILRYWQTQRVLEKRAALYPTAQAFTLSTSPPAAPAKPGIQEAYARTHQDLWSRYKSMCGMRLLRRGGWNTHGLPVELQVEDQLGITSRAQLDGSGMARFTDHCHQLALESIQTRQALNERLGAWEEAAEIPSTHASSAIQAVWGVLKQAWEDQHLCQEEHVSDLCPRCGSLLAMDEIVTTPVDIPAVYVRLPVLEDPSSALLVWTDRVWSLPGNVAVAVNPDAEYTIIERDLPEEEAGKGARPEKLILARAGLETVFGDEPVRVYETFRGSRLKGVRYRPLFQYMLPDRPAHRVILDDAPRAGRGSGLHQLVPAYDAHDRQLAQQNDLPVLTPVSADGTFVSEVRPWRGMFFRDAEGYILHDLQERGLLYCAETSLQAASFCGYCGTPLLPYVREAWYLHRPRPEQDWVVGRDRFWGTPLPIWQCNRCGHRQAVGSLEELSQLNGCSLADLDLHRPDVDDVAFACPECEGLMRRLPQVLDAGLDAAVLAMPAAQDEPALPADLVCEVSGEADHWLNALSALTRMAFDRPAYQHAIHLPPVMEAGEPLASSLTPSRRDPRDIIHDHGADALRWAFFFPWQPGDVLVVSDEKLQAARRDFLMPLWDGYAFLVNRAVRSGWSPERGLRATPVPPSMLDRWLSSRLNQLVKDVSGSLAGYDACRAAGILQGFVADLSGWYIPLCRRGFSQAVEAGEQQVELTALYETFVTLSRLLAPFIPFLAEEFYQKLVRAFDHTSPASVHLAQWPAGDEAQIDLALNHHMALAQQLAEMGRAARQQAGIAPRQPLAAAVVTLSSQEAASAVQLLSTWLAAALRVRQVTCTVDETSLASGEAHIVLDTHISGELVREGLAEEFSRRILDFRQNAGLPPEAFIRLFVTASPRLAHAIHDWQPQIMLETGCRELNLVSQQASQPPTVSAGIERGKASRRLYTMLEFDGERVTFGVEKVIAE